MNARRVRNLDPDKPAERQDHPAAASNREKQIMFFRPLSLSRAPISVSIRHTATLCFLILAALGLTSMQARAQSHFKGHVVRVESGDRIVARLDTWNVTIQLHGITCPTAPPEAALRARQYTTRRVLNSSVTVDVKGTGSNATVYGEVQLTGGKSLNNELVQVGLAKWSRRYAPYRYDIARSEAVARSAARGIWSVADASNVPMPPTPAPPARPKVIVVVKPPVRTPLPGALPQPTLAPASSTPAPTPVPLTPTPIPTPIPTPTPKPKALVQPARLSGYTRKPTTSPTGAPDFGESLSLFETRLRNLEEEAERSVYRTPVLHAISETASIAGVLAFVLQLAFGGMPSVRRIPFQFCVALVVALAGGLIAPFPYLLQSHKFTFGHGSLLPILAPPVIGALAFASVALCRREQILRAAPTIDLRDLAEQPTKDELIKVIGTVGTIPGSEPLVSQIGSIRAVYVREITYSYDPVQTASQGGRRENSGRHPTRYAWTVIYNEVSRGDFLLSDDEGGKAVVDGARAQFLPLRTARFYNGVPVENWFSRPYPGDTRTQIEFIGTNAPVVVWGKLSHVFSGSHEIPAARIGNDTYQNMLVVEGDEEQVWTRRPLVGLLAMLIALGLTLLVVYGLSTPGAFGGR